jgi:hypothetical protein
VDSEKFGQSQGKISQGLDTSGVASADLFRGLHSSECSYSTPRAITREGDSSHLING